MPPGVLLECFQVIEAHRLLVEDGHEKLQGVIVFQPGCLVGRHPEGEGVGLREHVLPVELDKDTLRRRLVNALSRRPGHELPAVLFDELRVVLPPEGAAQAVGLAGSEPGHVDGQLVYLVLEQDDPQCALQRPGLLRAIVS